MSANVIPIADLPVELSYDDAVEAVYGSELDAVAAKLRQRLSVVIECDKQLTLYLYRALRRRLKSGAMPITLTLISGHAAADDPQSAMQTLMQRQLSQLRDAVFAGQSDQIVAMPHLDILTTTTQSGLSAETREAAALVYENPDLVFLAFKDPSFELPQVIMNLFTVRQSLIGIPRDRLRHLVVQREARKLGVEKFNPYSLYKYLSGLNAIRARQVLSHLDAYVDFDPAHPDSLTRIFAEIRQMTLIGDVELPRIDLEKDIGGYDDVKKRIRTEILDLLHNKEKSGDADTIRQVEQIIPKGMIFFGPPGTGKTFFAKAIATAIDATISIVSGPELKSRWVGASEQNLRRVFAQARKSAPSVIVFDELDSFAAARGTYTGSGVEHSMVNQLLTEMDGFRREELVFVIGTTNFVESLDPALLRPGRFELSIDIPYPHTEDRWKILNIYREKFSLDFDDELLDYVVSKTGGFVDSARSVRFSGDHLYAIMRALKREQIRAGGELTITREHIDDAIGGKQRRPIKLREREQRTIAIHEAGHAVCAYTLPHCPTIERVTIATGEQDTLGYVMQKAQDDKYVTTRLELLDDVCVLLAGRAAEQMLIGDISVGAYNDLQRATRICRAMVEELGMSDAGLRSFADDAAMDGRRPARGAMADATAAAIDAEISRILLEQSHRAEQTLTQHRGTLESMVKMLLEKKTIELKEVAALFEGKSFKKDETLNNSDRKESGGPGVSPVA